MYIINFAVRTPRQTFGKRLRAVREEQNISQEKLAEMMGGHRNTIGKIERGETNFTFDYVVEIARALKVRPSVFFDFVP